MPTASSGQSRSGAERRRSPPRAAPRHHPNSPDSAAVGPVLSGIAASSYFENHTPAIEQETEMHVKHSIAGAMLSAAVPGVLLGAGAGASIARSPADSVATATKTATVGVRACNEPREAPDRRQ
jgi:hypothetical protein